MDKLDKKTYINIVRKIMKRPLAIFPGEWIISVL